MNFRNFKLLIRISAAILPFAVLLVFNNCGQMESSSVTADEQASNGSSIIGTPAVGPVVEQGELSTKVHSILKRKCASCHNSEISFKGIDDILNLSMLKSSGLIDQVYLAAKSGLMPPTGEKLTPVEISYINDWRKGQTKIKYSINNECSVEAAKLMEPTDNRLWAINRDEYKSIISDVFKFTRFTASRLPELLIKDKFRNHTDSMVIDDYVFSVLTNYADEIAKLVSKDEGKIRIFWGCTSYSPNSASTDCKNRFIRVVTEKLLRKKLTSAESNNYLNIFNLGSDFDKPVQKGIENVIFAALISPHFLYKKEIGDSRYQMDNYAIAESLALQIWQSVPDTELLRAASRFELYDPILRERQIRRMLNTAKGKLFFNRFIKDYFEVDNLEKIGADTGLKQSLLNEFDGFVTDIMRQPSSFNSLFNWSESVIDGRLSRDVYKIGSRSGRQKHNSNERSGILTLPAYLYSTSNKVGIPSHISRGVFVREKLLCQVLGSPPDLEDNTGETQTIDRTLTARQRFEKTHLTKTSCKSCHSMIDPIGFGLDHFNDFGAVIQTDPSTGAAIDRKGYVNFTSITNFNFDGAAQLASRLGSSDEVAGCFVEQSYRYISGGKITPNNLCAVERIKKRFVNSNKNIFDLIVSILNEDNKYLRK